MPILHTMRFAVIGVSGSGKSSLVRAGLLPALHSGKLASAGHRWNVYLFKPGNGPLANLAKELVRDGGGSVLPTS